VHEVKKPGTINELYGSEILNSAAPMAANAKYLIEKQTLTV